MPRLPRRLVMASLLIALPAAAMPPQTPPRPPVTVTAPALGALCVTLQTNLKDAQAKVAELKNLAFSLKAAREKLAASRASRDQAVQELNAARNSPDQPPPASSTVVQLEARVSKLDAELAQLDKSVQAMQQRIDQCRKDLEALQGAGDELQQKVADAAIKEKSSGKSGEKVDEAIKSVSVYSYGKVAELLRLHPDLRPTLTAAQTKMLGSFEKLYPKDIAAVVSRNLDAAAARAADEAGDSKGSAEAARERRKAALDSMQKFLDLLRSMQPNI